MEKFIVKLCLVIITKRSIESSREITSKIFRTEMFFKLFWSKKIKINLF